MAGKRAFFDGLKLTELLISAAEFVVLLGLWMLFVSLLQWNEFTAGIAAALIGAVGDAVVKATDFARFRPRLGHLLLIFTEPWYVAKDTLVVFWALARHIAGMPSQSNLNVIPFEGGEDDVEGSARRALAIAYSTISPNTIVLGIDRERNLMLLHQMVPSPTPWITRQLGAQK